MAMMKMAFPAEDDDDLDVDALRLAALSTLKKTAAQPAHTPSSSMSTLQVSNGPRLQLKGGPRPHQNRGRGRGHNMNMNMRRGRGRGGFPNSFNPPQNFFPNRPLGNSNLITIVPTVPNEPCSLSDGQQQSSKSPAKMLANSTADSTLLDEEKVPAKFRRLDDDSDSEESDDDADLKLGSDLESSEEDDDDDDKEDAKTRENPDSESGKDDDLVSLQPEDNEGDNSLERLMQELEDEISEAPKVLDNKKSASASKETVKVEKLQRAKKGKKEKQKKESSPSESAHDVKIQASSSFSFQQGDLINQPNDSKRVSSPQLQESMSRSLSTHQTFKAQSRSPPNYQSVTRHFPERSPRAASPVSINSPLKTLNTQRLLSPARSPLGRKTKSPRRSRTPVEIRSPRRSRSPRKSRSPLRSAPRSHYHASSRSPVRRSGSRSPYRSPRRSPHYLPPRISPSGRHLPLRSRSRSPGRPIYVRRSRSRSPLRRSPTSGRLQSPYRRSRSRSPGGRLYVSRRSRSFSPRAPLGSRRSPSPRSRRSPVYAKKSSPKRRSVTPRRRSISPHRSPSPRRRSGSPRRRSVSPRRRPVSPGWSRSSPPRGRSPVGSFRQGSPRRRSPYGDTYVTRRSPSPVTRKYSPLHVHRPVSPSRAYRSPSPSSRNIRRRSPTTTIGPHRRSPHHRPASPVYNPSPTKQTKISRSPGVVREKLKRLSPPPVLRSNPRPPSPRRQRSPVPHVRSHHGVKTSPDRRISPAIPLRRSPSPSKEGIPSGRAGSPFDSISLSPSPERQPTIKGLDDRGRGRKSHPLAENHPESKRPRTEPRSVLPRRKDTDGESIGASRSEELSKREKREKKRLKREKERLKKEAQQESSNILEARRRKFQSSMPVEVSGKRIRLRNMASDQAELEDEDMDSREPEVNIEKEKERELKEVNEVDESILDRELMGGVDLLWSDEEEAEEDEETSAANNVQFKRTFNLPSASNSSGKENIPEDSNDSKKDDDEGNDAEQPSSTVGSPLITQTTQEDSEQEDCEAVSECSEDADDTKEEKEPQDAWPKTNRELKEFIISQAKGGSASSRNPKPSAKSSKKSKATELDIDLRAELSRRRAERLTKVCPEVLPGRLLQSALQGVGVKSRREKSHRRRGKSPPLFEDDLDQQESDGRRVLVLRRAAEKREPAINITISKVEPSQESSSLKISGKLPIHLRLGTGKKADEGLQKVKLKRNITVGRKKQV